MTEFPFREEKALEAARAATGLSDFGGDAFREGLRLLLETYNRAAGLSERGRKHNWQRVVLLLSTRLRIQETLRKHPEIREREIRRPVYLTGLPRTGTSALFNLLASDPAARPLLAWEGIFPDPLEGLEPGQIDPRHEAMRAADERTRQRDPEFSRIHHTGADMPEECVLLLAHAFCDVQVGIEVLMEPYGPWFQNQDLRTSYAYYADLLRMLDFQRPGERWLLKSPAHLWALDALLEQFPDGCIVMTHRNPLECIPSYCSMIDTLLNSRGCAPRPDLGKAVLEYLARSLERGLRARDALDSGHFFDVDYRTFLADPLSTVAGLYEYFGLGLDESLEATLAAHTRDNPQGRHGTHEYGLEKYGLTPDAVRSRLADYIERFGLGSTG
ncbi:MAG: sulfotransferase [Myxococcales bacterium]|nr:sulfotransferase [Myxococcales bacterium]